MVMLKKIYIVLSLLLVLLVGRESFAQEPKDASVVGELIAKLEDPNSDQVLVVAHRGDWRHAPENSLKAIQNSIDMGADMVEIDVRMTRDSVLVLMHDEKIDRTTTGSGYIWDFTYDSLQSFFLRDGLLHATPHKVPTLEEALALSKDKILINLDTKDYENLGLYYELLRSTRTLNQVVIKAPIRKSEIEKIFGTYLSDIYFMPLVRTHQPGAEAMVLEYQNEDPPVAFEFTVPSDTIPLIAQFSEIRRKGSRVWVNSLQPHHCAGYSDEQAALDIATYDWFIDHGVNIIQTDRPALLINYLKKRGLHD